MGFTGLKSRCAGLCSFLEALGKSLFPCLGSPASSGHTPSLASSPFLCIQHQQCWISLTLLLSYLSLWPQQAKASASKDSHDLIESIQIIQDNLSISNSRT